MAEKKKSVELDDIVADLDEKKIEENVKQHWEAENTYSLADRNAKPEGYDDFKKEVHKYMKHHYKDSKMDEATAFVKFEELIEMGTRAGMKGLDIETLQSEAKKRGMGSVIKHIASLAEAKAKSDYTRGILRKIDPQDWDAQVKLMEQYREKWKNMLPKGFKTKSAAQLAQDYEKIIQNHVNTISEPKHTLKKYDPSYAKEAA